MSVKLAGRMDKLQEQNLLHFDADPDKGAEPGNLFFNFLRFAREGVLEQGFEVDLGQGLIALKGLGSVSCSNQCHWRTHQRTLHL